MTSPEQKIEVAAYYFPNYHPDPRNALWHGKGWTEWELVKAARPRFPGHRQPIVPAWGYFDESDPEWAAKEIEIAVTHGVTCFLYDWYYYEDGPYLEAGLEQGLLKAPNNEEIKFALMWANHDWHNNHPARLSGGMELLAPGGVSPAGFDRLTDYVVNEYFVRPNYLQIKGCPYFQVYDLPMLISGLGGVNETIRALDGFREKTRRAGFPDLHLNGCASNVTVLPGETLLDNPAAIVERFGFASVGSYVWVHHYNLWHGAFPEGSYAMAAQANYAEWEKLLTAFPVPYYPNVTMGWDCSPQTAQTDVFEQRNYPFCSILAGNTPEAFEEALRRARAFVERPDVMTKLGHAPMVTINAWNEWTEGSYLLPDTVRGTAYLEAIRRVFRDEKP